MPGLDHLLAWAGAVWDTAVRAWLPANVAALLASPRGHTLAMALLLMLALVWLRGYVLGMQRRARTAQRPEDRPLRRRRQPWYRRFAQWRRGLGRQPWYWKIGKHVASLDQTHGLVIGGSGSGKSTLVVQLILQPCINLFMWLMRCLGKWQRRPVLIVSFDRSDPIEEATNVLEDRGVPVERWRVRQSNGWDMLQGDVEMIAEALPDGFSKAENDTGFFRQLATDAIAAALREQDEEAELQGLRPGALRYFDDMVERMDRIMADDPEVPDLARRTWVRRFRSLARVMGESLGQDFDLVGALKAGKVVHLSSNSYTNPALTPLVGAMAITHAKLAAEQVSGVYLVLEEAGFLKRRSGVLDDLARAMRARGWRIVYLSQDPNDVGDVLQVNFGVAVFMGLGPLAQKAREWCASVVKGFPGAFRAEELVLGATIDQLEGYVLLNGRCRDVSLPPYITGPAEHRPAERRPRWQVVSVDNPSHGTDLVPSRGRGAKNGPFHGTDSRDARRGTHTWECDWPALDGWRRELRLPAGGQGSIPSPPAYYVADPHVDRKGQLVLLKLWPLLSGIDDPLGCWLIPQERTNGDANRSKVWLSAGTEGWGEVVSERGGYVTGYELVCRALHGPKPFVLNADGSPRLDKNGKPIGYQVDHWCHTEDLTCPGGEACQHVRCMNGEHMSWVTPQQNTVRMQVRRRRRQAWLAGTCTAWSETVAQEADRLIAERLPTPENGNGVLGC